MIQTVYCDGCGQSGALPVRLAYRYHSEWCGECRHTDNKEFAYFFCSLNCLAPFIKERFNEATSTLTLPCRIEWAHQAGSETACPACEGKKFVE